MRFPFKFMSLLALAFAAWIGLYLLGHRPADQLAFSLGVIAALGSAGFGVYGLLRSPDRTA